MPWETTGRKIYAQHLRSAYFALVLVWVAAIAISFSHSETPISPAHEQLDQIWELLRIA